MKPSITAEELMVKEFEEMNAQSPVNIKNKLSCTQIVSI
jgi:hypothetical protein